MRSDQQGPLNIGSDRLISINELCRLVLRIAGREELTLLHVPGPQGVRGRNSENSMTAKLLGWRPTIPLEQGLAETYRWIEERLALTQSARLVPSEPKVHS